MEPGVHGIPGQVVQQVVVMENGWSAGRVIALHQHMVDWIVSEILLQWQRVMTKTVLVRLETNIFEYILVI